MLQIRHPYVHHERRSIPRGALAVHERSSKSFAADELLSTIMGKRDGVRSDRPSSRSYSISHSIGGRSDLSESDAEKKRSKLGYQRISIACAHCRRRKIRCLIAEGDPEQRCQNCIRLKKECNFYPVDQQPPMDNQMSTSGKSTRSRSNAGMASSPSASFERKREGPEIGGMASSSNTYHGLPIEPGRSLSVQGGLADSEYEYPAGPDVFPRYNPQNPFLSAHSAVSTTQNHWRSPDNRPPHDYGSYPPDTRTPPMNPSSQQTSLGAEPGWQHGNTRPTMPYHRSLSYGDHENLPNTAYPYGTAVQSSTHPQSANIRYPPSTMDMHSMPVHPPASGPRGAPSIGHGVNHMTHQQPYAIQQAQQVTTSSATQPIYSHQWYPTASSAGQGTYPGRSE